MTTDTMAGHALRSFTLGLMLLGGTITPVIAAEGDTPATTAAINTAAAPKPPSVTVMRAGKSEVVETLIVSGSFVPREEILVVPEFEGAAVTEILAEQGDTVKKGQILARLSDTSVMVQFAQNDASIARSDASISQAKAQIAEAQAAFNDAKTALERTSALRRNGVSTVEQLDQRQASFNAAQARFNSAQQLLAIAEADRKAMIAQRDELQIRLDRTQIKAPADGVISRRSIRIGAIASAAQDAMFRIIADGDIELDGEVTEADLPRLKADQKVTISVGGVANTIEGRVRLISPEVNAQTRLGNVRVAIPKGSPVSIGAFGRGIVEIARSSGVTLPMTAVTFQRDGTIAQTVTDGKVAVRKVKTGLIGDGKVEILEGVAEGDMVVARAGTFLRDGDQVTPVEMKAGSN